MEGVSRSVAFGASRKLRRAKGRLRWR